MDNHSLLIAVGLVPPLTQRDRNRLSPEFFEDAKLRADFYARLEEDLTKHLGSDTYVIRDCAASSITIPDPYFFSVKKLPVKGIREDSTLSPFEPFSPSLIYQVRAYDDAVQRGRQLLSSHPWRALQLARACKESIGFAGVLGDERRIAEAARLAGQLVRPEYVIASYSTARGEGAMAARR